MNFERILSSRVWRGVLVASTLYCGARVALAEAPPVPMQLDLQGAIAYALDNNFSIRQARERIREQEGLIVEVKSAVLPDVSLNSAYGYTSDGLLSSNVVNPNWQIALQVRQLVYSGGGVQAALDAQRLVRESALLDLQTVIHDQLLQVRINFYNVLLAREQISVQEQNVALLREQLQTAKNRFDAGSVSNFDVLRAEVELANAQPPLIRARNNLRTSIDELRFSLGFDSRAAADLTRVPNFIGTLDIDRMSIDLAAAIDSARAHRPELARLSKISEARDAGIKIARSNRLPTVAVTGGYQVRNLSSSSRFGDSLDGWTVGLQSSWAIFDGRATTGRVNQALSQKEQAKLQLDEATLAVEVEVRRALSALSEATELAEAASRVVEQADEALRLANARYGAGTSTQLELLAAQVALTQARDNQLQANYSYNVASSTLRRAMGRGDVFFKE